VAEDKKDKIVIAIGISANYGKGLDLTDLVDVIEGVAKKRGGKKPNFKVSAEINLLS
jgi:retrograde regulation protein 2